jgi:hypothetical protein
MDTPYMRALVELYAKPPTDTVNLLWEAPQMSLFNGGTIVFLHIEDEDKPELDVHAYHIQAEEMKDVLSVKLAMHKKRIYVEMVSAFVQNVKAQSDKIQLHPNTSPGNPSDP